MENIYSCSYCGTTTTKNSTPSQSGCTVQHSHHWVNLGETGNNNFKCNNCSLVVSTKNTPQQSGCTKASSHYWKKA